MTVKRQKHPKTWLFILLVVLTFLLPLSAHALTQITLEWDPVLESDVAGYRVFSRLVDEAYDYNTPLWEGFDTSCVIDFPDDELIWYFVVRAFDTQGFESINSNEVCYRCPAHGHTLNDSDGGTFESDDTGCFVDCMPF